MLFRGWMIRACAFVLICVAVQVGRGDPPAAEKSEPEAKVIPDAQRMPVAEARQRARLMHDIYAATLDVMHHRYFHGGRAIVPARAMEDIFEEIQRDSHTEARWISVNLKPMSIHHKPKTKFEKHAADEIAKGEPAVDIVEDGYYRRATAIPMSGGCIGCHDGFFKKPTKEAKFTGLVISIPVLEAKPEK
ncbi:c-type heme family protein [Rosistilla oblonga]|uniref:c-type heme family protein n=1 Tax=Rosistilla oblonga TaxID=2527990 RepID=UPI003A97DAA7